jgi:uncharacterized protein YjbI with pentapeptide repeats
MANQEHLDILKQGVAVWNEWREKNHGVRPDLRHADLRNTDLRSATLCYADLRNANLSSARLDSADLSGADLTSAILQAATLNNTVLQNTNLAKAAIKWTVFANNNLSFTKGLELAQFFAPATIGVDTISKSCGNIAKSFLIGCGLSDWEIEGAQLYNPDLSNEEINNIYYRIHDLRVRRAFQINPLFISYSHSDSSFIDAAEKHLIEEGIRYWRDIHHAKAGRLEKQIDEAIHVNDVVLLVLSEHSANSDWVEHEARKAREKERRTGKDAMCPVALDSSWKTCRWPERLREQIMEYNILDFSNWQDDGDFQKMFGKLLEGLNLFYK